MSENGTHLFTYGTLMVPDIMARVSGCSSTSLAAELAGAVRYGVRGEEYPGLVRSGGGRVQGMLYLDLPAAAISRLDLFEGEYYRREQVEVSACDTGRVYCAMAYIFKPEYGHLLTEKPWEYSEFLQKGRALFELDYSGYLALD